MEKKKMANKADFLNPDRVVEHIDIKTFNTVTMVEAMGKTAFQARNLHRAADILVRMVEDDKCSIILTIAGSLISAGMKQIIIDMMKANMIDAIVSTGAVIVDQDFFEALGFKHYQGTPFVDDNIMRDLMIDRIYDTYIDEEELRVCDMTTAEIANSLEARPHSSREFISEMGKWLVLNNKGENSIVRIAYEMGIPIFVPAFSDCSAGFGMVYHQFHNKEHMSLDSAKDFLELTKIKIAAEDTGIFMLGGGVPKNFTQDIVVAADILEKECDMHKYAVQLTVADERDGGLSGSTLKEASSWGKVETTYEQMVFGEVTINFPMIASYAYHKADRSRRQPKRYADIFNNED
jgi:deoxyhypusine synthase